jgi:hypothetical protein
MKQFRSTFLAGVLLSLLAAPTARATIVDTIDLELVSINAVGGTLIVFITYDPPLPIPGTGLLNDPLTKGDLEIDDYSSFIDLSGDGDDVELEIADWGQKITAIDGLGNITSTGRGTVNCIVVGGIGGLICGTVDPDVGGWPPADGSLGTSSAVIDDGAQTIVVVDNSNVQAGTITSTYTYTIVPEPAAGAQLLAGLCGIIVMARHRAREGRSQA